MEDRVGRALKTRLSLYLGRATGHVGEYTQGPVLFQDEPTTCILTNPCSIVEVVVGYQPDPDADTLVIQAEGASAKIRRVVDQLEVKYRRRVFGVLFVNPPALFKCARGFGLSTAELTATIMAITSAWGIAIRPEEVLGLCLAAEGASDSVLLERPAFFLSRKGKVLEALGNLPSHCQLSFDAASPDFPGIPTPATFDYSLEHLREYSKVRELVRSSTSTGDLTLLTQATERSAVLNQELIPFPRFDDLRTLCAEAKAAGFLIAHTGTAASLLFEDTALGWDRANRALPIVQEAGFDFKGLWRTK